MKLKIFDSNGTELNIGDIVQIQDKRNDGLTFFAKVQIINGRIYPLDSFVYDRIIKVDEIPENCIYRSSKNDYEYWIGKNMELKLIDEGRYEKWRKDNYFFKGNTFFEVHI